jgi:hypothetical protein
MHVLLRGVVASSLTLVLMVQATAAAMASPGSVPVKAAPVLSQAQLVTWYQAAVPSNAPLRAGSPSVPIQELVRIYYEEGAKEGVAPDLAFLQALHETYWFSFPEGGCVRPTDHNYAGMGAHSCTVLNSDGLPRYVWRFGTVREGVRAQMQYLRAYADPTVSRPADLGSPLPVAVGEPPNPGATFERQWQWIVSSYRVTNGGPWPFWEQYGAGIWAADPLYWSKIERYTQRALTYHGYPTDAYALRTWLLRNNNSGGAADITGYLGRSFDELLACDWNGDGRDTPASFAAGRWTISNLPTGAGPLVVFSFGRTGDVPICGDWNGDGRDMIGVIRDGAWHLKHSLSGGGADLSFNYGRVTRGDLPVVGDWNRDGRDTPGIIRDGEWHLRNTLSGGQGQIVFNYGRVTRGDLPLVGDWNGDGRDTPGIVRDGEWHLRNALSGGQGQIVFNYGRTTRGDLPVVGDWNGSGVDSPGVVR